MRRSHFCWVLALLLCSGITLAGKGTDYGQGLSGKKTIKVARLMSDPEPHVGKTVRVKGVVTGVCEMAGCWMTLDAGDAFEDLRIKVNDGVIVFPVSAKGQPAVAEGTFTKIEMSLEKTIDFKRHHAEEQGESFDPASVTEPMVMYQVNATGARIF